MSKRCMHTCEVHEPCYGSLEAWSLRRYGAIHAVPQDSSITLCGLAVEVFDHAVMCGWWDNHSKDKCKACEHKIALRGLWANE